MHSNLSRNPRLISLFTAICMVVANTIGTGVFTSLGFQAADIKSGFALLLLWFIGGIFALCGALSYSELAAAMPRSGGEFHYLSQTYHPIVGFLTGWVSITVGFAAPIAAAAIAFGEYFSRVFPVIAPLAIAPLIVILISLIHTRNLQVGSYFQSILTVLKVLLIVVFIVCGFLFAEPQPIGFLPTPNDSQLIFSSPFAISLVYVAYAYSGWNASVYIASELKEPEKNVPRSLLIGTAIVMVLYLLLNLIFLYSTPIQELAGKLEVGYLAANHIFGSKGAPLMALLISFGLLSSISSMVWAGPRVSQVIGEDIPFFKLLAKKNANDIPYHGICLQLFIVLVLVFTSTFEAVITYLGFTLTLSSFLTVLGVFVHRIKFPDVPRPYKTWGYPLTPIIFLAISAWMLIYIFRDKPAESLAGLGTIALGLPVYFFASKNNLVSSSSK
ncbi:MAG TPA: amino acid permease [Allocoleopsis sp.]